MQIALSVIDNLSLQVCLEVSSEQVELPVPSISNTNMNQLLCFILLYCYKPS